MLAQGLDGILRNAVAGAKKKVGGLGHQGRRRLGPAVSEFDQGHDHDLGRLARQEDVAEVALFLSSRRSHAITGQLIPVESGLK